MHQFYRNPTAQGKKGPSCLLLVGSSTAEDAVWTWLNSRWTLRPAGKGDPRTTARRCDRNELTQVLRRDDVGDLRLIH